MRRGRPSKACPDVLWFLHADTRVAPGSCALVLAALRDPDVVGGHFRVSFGRSTHARLLAAFYHVIQRFGVVYGDSAVFCRRTAFEAAGGFPPHPIMEDLAFVQALRRRGPRRPAILLLHSFHFSSYIAPIRRGSCCR